VFYGNANYDEANNVGVFDAGNNNVYEPAEMPIRQLVRGLAVTRGGKMMLPVVSIDPRPAGDALTSVAAAPDDGFFTPANYRGGFDPNDNWMTGWTAFDAYGMSGAAPKPGDADGDDDVDLDDFVILKQHFGQSGVTRAEGDFDGDGDVDLDDFVLLKANFGG